MGTMGLKSPASPLFTEPFIRAQIKEIIKAPRHWPLGGEFTGDFPAKMTSNAKNVSISWRHHEKESPGQVFLNIWCIKIISGLDVLAIHTLIKCDMHRVLCDRAAVYIMMNTIICLSY